MLNKLLIVFISSLFFISLTSGQTGKLYPYYKAGKWGLCDIDKNIVVEPVYDDISALAYDCASITNGDKTGIISLVDGKILTDFEYEKITNLYAGLHSAAVPYFEVVLRGKSGLIDVSGNLIIQPEYDDVEICWDDKVFILKKGNKQKFYFIHQNTSSGWYDEAMCFDGPNFLYAINDQKVSFFYANTGKQITESKYVFNPLGLTLDGPDYLYMVEKNSRYGVIDSAGKEIVKTEYSNISYINDSLYVVKKAGKYGAINNKNKVIIPFIYKDFDVITTRDSNYVETDTYILFSDNKKNDIYHSYKKISSLKNYDEIKNLPSSEFFIAKENGFYGIINLYGETIYPFIYNEIKPKSMYDYDLTLTTRIENKYGVIYPQKRIEIKPKYDDIIDESNGLILILDEKNRRSVVNYMDSLIVPPVYDRIDIEDGIISLSQDDKSGIADMNGSIIIQTHYQYIYPAKYSLFIVGNHKKEALFSAEGKQLTAFMYDNISRYCYQSECDDSTFTIEVNGKEGRIDVNGKEIIAPEYDSVYRFNGPVFCVKKNKREFFYKEGNIPFYEE